MTATACLRQYRSVQTSGNPANDGGQTDKRLGRCAVTLYDGDLSRMGVGGAFAKPSLACADGLPQVERTAWGRMR